MTAPSKDSDQPGHLPSLIRVFSVRMQKALVLSYPLSTKRRLWSDWADAQADLSLRWAHSHFVVFLMRRLIFVFFFVESWRNIRETYPCKNDLIIPVLIYSKKQEWWGIVQRSVICVTLDFNRYMYQSYFLSRTCLFNIYFKKFDVYLSNK